MTQHWTDTRDVIDCPICGREMPMMRRASGLKSPLTPKELWLLRRMSAIGIGRKVTAYMVGCNEETVTSVLYRDRHRAT